ncbi:MAG: 4-hydroxy-tetrahydrodipicolinate synthase, partial [Planctomycetota bacterium]
LHQFAKSIGASAVLSVNPYYNKPTQDGLYAHFAALSEKVDIPIVLYNIPGRTGVTMQPETVAKLYANANIVAIKEATGDVTMATRIMQACDITVVSGDDPLALPTMAIGGSGVISVLSNVMPGTVAEMCKLAAAGDYTKAAAIHHKVYPLTRALFLDGNPVGVKKAMHLLGRDSGEVRLPLVEASDATVADIQSAMQSLDLL